MSLHQRELNFHLLDYDLEHPVRYYTPLPSRVFTTEEEAFIASHVHRYLSRNRPTVANLYNNLCHGLRGLNDDRMEQGLPALRMPSLATFRRRVAALPERVVWHHRSARVR